MSGNKSKLKQLQGIQDALAYVVANIRRRDHITPTMQSLHWLKVHEHINYKVILLACNVLQTRKLYLIISIHHSVTTISHIKQSHLQSVLQLKKISLIGYNKWQMLLGWSSAQMIVAC